MHHGEETLLSHPGTQPRAEVTAEVHARGKEQDAGGVRLPGVMGTAGGFGWHRVAAGGAMAPRV